MIGVMFPLQRRCGSVDGFVPCVQCQTPAWLLWRQITGGLLISVDRNGTSVNPHNIARLLVCLEKLS